MTVTRATLHTVDAVTQFVFGGNATFTLESKSGARFTYQVRESDKPDLFFVSVLTGADNTGDFSYLGFFRVGAYSHGRKSRVSADAPSARAFAWFAQVLALGGGQALPGSLRFWHEGRCAACARKLTVPASVATGFGPECAERRGIAWQAPRFAAENLGLAA
jgi:hypothetical protein